MAKPPPRHANVVWLVAVGLDNKVKYSVMAAALGLSVGSIATIIRCQVRGHPTHDRARRNKTPRITRPRENSTWSEQVLTEPYAKFKQRKQAERALRRELAESHR